MSKFLSKGVQEQIKGEGGERMGGGGVRMNQEDWDMGTGRVELMGR